MMEFIFEHWGDLFSTAGVLVSLGGLAWAVTEARGARSAAESAKEAADETRGAIGRHLLTIDLERSINLIQRLKALHRDSRWELSLELYQVLRAMLSAIIARYPEDASELREQLSEARISITLMEEYVESLLVQGLGTEDIFRLNQQLNEVQSDLEDLSSRIGLGN